MTEKGAVREDGKSQKTKKKNKKQETEMRWKLSEEGVSSMKERLIRCVKFCL